MIRLVSFLKAGGVAVDARLVFYHIGLGSRSASSMRPSRCSRVTQFLLALSSSSSRAVLRRCTTNSFCARSTAFPPQRSLLDPQPAPLLLRHLLGALRGPESPSDACAQP